VAVTHPISEHDVVLFREAVQGWPTGTVGTVVNDYGDVVLVEVSSESGNAMGLSRCRWPSSNSSADRGLSKVPFKVPI
jgi:hypothetical protein